MLNLFQYAKTIISIDYLDQKKKQKGENSQFGVQWTNNGVSEEIELFNFFWKKMGSIIISVLLNF